ncbi:MAG: hypothetical protein ACLVJ6_15735 [Merdibacter sp.]
MEKCIRSAIHAADMPNSYLWLFHGDPTSRKVIVYVYTYLKNRMKGNRMITSAYVHVPFCRSICAYCDFARWMYQEETAWEWLRQLEKRPKDAGTADDALHRGGTPNALTAAQLEALLALFDRHHAPGMEFTLSKPGIHRRYVSFHLCTAWGQSSFHRCAEL